MKILIICENLKDYMHIQSHVIQQIECLSSKHEIILFVKYTSTENLFYLRSICSKLMLWSDNPKEDIKDDLEYDIIIAHSFTSFYIAIDLSIASGKRIIYTLHEIYFEKSSNIQLVKDINKYAYKLIILDYENKRLLLDDYGLDKDKLKVNYTGVDIYRYRDFGNIDWDIYKSLGFECYKQTIGIIDEYCSFRDTPTKRLIRILPKIADKLNGLNVFIVTTDNNIDKLKEIALKYQHDELNITICNIEKSLSKYFNLTKNIFCSNRIGIEAICTGCNVFQISDMFFGVPVTIKNYKDTLFNTNKLRYYPEKKLIESVLEFMKIIPDYELHFIIRSLCDKNRINKRLNIMLEGE